MNSHLVTVEVSVVSCTYQWVKFKCTAFYKHRFKCLNTKTVECRSTVEKNWVAFDYFFKCIPYFAACFFYFFLSGLDVCCVSLVYEFSHNKWLEEFESHFFWKTALVHLEGWTNNDNGTAGVVNTFTEKVLTETALFTFEHIRQGFERTVGCTACYRSAASAVVDESVNSFLKHTFFVSYDDVRSGELKKFFKTVVTIVGVFK